MPRQANPLLALLPSSRKARYGITGKWRARVFATDEPLTRWRAPDASAGRDKVKAPRRPDDRLLADNDVDVWQVDLDRPGPETAAFGLVLSNDESERARRFHFRKDHDRFLVARGFLRRVLASYLTLSPKALTFTYSPHGKPSLALTGRDWRPRFNLSHAGGIALLAVASGREVGIDVEQVRLGMAAEHIPELFFSKQEVSTLRDLPLALQDQAFFACWTRKEAYVKAKGQGLSIPLDQFDVSLAPGEPAAILRIRTDPLEAGRWAMSELPVPAGYRAALVVEGHDIQVRRRTFSSMDTKLSKAEEQK
jgi:4'-phosphopantetheinyl transferase